MASSFTIFSIFAVNKIDQFLVCYCVFQGGTDMAKKDKRSSDPVALMATEKLNASIASTVKIISDLTKDKNIEKEARVELLKLYNDQLAFLRKQVDNLTEDQPTTWDGIAMKAFTQK